MSEFVPRKELIKMILPPVLAVALFIATVFGILLPNYRTSLMDQQKRMLISLSHVAWNMVVVIEEQERAGRFSRMEAQQIAIRHLRGMRYGSDNLDYFWINDLRPYMIMNPYRTDLEGKDVATISDPKGKFLFQEFVNVAQNHGEGFVSYVWQWKNNSSRIEPKLSFVKYFAPWGWVLGTGIYLNDVNYEIAALSRNLIISSGLIIFIVSLLTFYMTMRAFQTAKRRMRAEVELKEHEIHLEELVKERTYELAETNLQLSQEVIQRKKLAEDLLHISITDMLTGLYNRRGFIELSKKQLQGAARRNDTIFLLYMDLDGMKFINDHFGHEMGDQALVETACIFKETFRESDIVGRLGGDEFAVLMVVEKQQADEQAITHRIGQQFRVNNSQSDSPYNLSISIGVAKYDNDSPCSLEDLMSKADTLMYEQKKLKRFKQ